MNPQRNRRLGALLRDETGIALPVAMAVLGMVLLLGGIAFSSAEGTRDQSNQDRRQKRALQAADAGLDAAVWRMNMFDVANIDDSSQNSCVQRGVDGRLTLVAYQQDGGQNWCPPVTEDLGTGARFSYRVSSTTVPTLNQVSRTIVSTGTADGKGTRRIAMRVIAGRGIPLFGNYSVLASRGISLDSNATIGAPGQPASVRSNDDIALKSNAQICGNANPGPNGEVVLQGSAKVCSGYSTAQAPAPYVPAKIDAGTAATDNNNFRICLNASGGDPCQPRQSTAWNPTTRRLILDSNSKITMGGFDKPYYLCQLHLKSNSQIVIPSVPLGADGKAAGAIRIYMAPPSECGNQSDPQVLFDSNTHIRNANGDPLTFQLYVLGDDREPPQGGTVQLNSNSELRGIVYAPRSNVIMDSNSKLIGGVAGYSVKLNSNASVRYDSRVSALITGTVTLSHGDSYRECTPQGGATPDAKC